MSQSQTQSQSQSSGKTETTDTHANELWRTCIMEFLHKGGLFPVDKAIDETNKVVTAYLANIKCREVNE